MNLPDLENAAWEAERQRLTEELQRAARALYLHAGRPGLMTIPNGGSTITLTAGAAMDHHRKDFN